jgi:hypothetical protein
MRSTAIPIRARAGNSTRSNPFLRGFLEGAAGLLDLFAIGSQPSTRRTPEDDTRKLRSDVEQIAQDFRAVLTGIETTSKK